MAIGVEGLERRYVLANEAVAHEVDVVIIGGCGRVGLPLGIALASRGLTVSSLRHRRQAR